MYTHHMISSDGRSLRSLGFAPTMAVTFLVATGYERRPEETHAPWWWNTTLTKPTPRDIPALLSHVSNPTAWPPPPPTSYTGMSERRIMSFTIHLQHLEFIFTGSYTGLRSLIWTVLRKTKNVKGQSSSRVLEVGGGALSDPPLLLFLPSFGYLQGDVAEWWFVRGGPPWWISVWPLSGGAEPGGWMSRSRGNWRFPRFLPGAPAIAGWVCYRIQTAWKVK